MGRCRGWGARLPAAARTPRRVARVARVARVVAGGSAPGLVATPGLAVASLA